MPKSKVYFQDLRQNTNLSRPEKLKRLLAAAGFGKLDLSDRYVAIKTHFGEMGNLAYLRPNYARVVVDSVRAIGGKPFLTDCNTLYVGSRKDALEHIETAYINGFSPYATGCQVIIADGLRGTDDVEVPVSGGELLHSAKIGRAVMDADFILSLNHFKCHELTGFGGALKNLGMGCGSRAGKKEMHCDGVTQVDSARCIGCGACVRVCAHSAPKITAGKAAIDPKRCVGCGRCIGVCPKDAISPVWGDSAFGAVDKKIAEYAAAILQHKPGFHVSLVVDVAPFCDCHGENALSIVPDIGFFASFDPVALDQACADAVIAAPGDPRSLLGENCHAGHDHFKTVAPTTDWSIQLDHAVKLGLGSREYELISC